MQTTEAEAFDYVVRWAGAEPDAVAPLLEGEVEDILDSVRLRDSCGISPQDPDWTPTFWLPRAVQMAFELRAVRAAASVDVTADGTTVRASQHHAALLGQAALWRSRCGGSFGGMQ